jgi:hypothetical protein
MNSKYLIFTAVAATFAFAAPVASAQESVNTPEARAAEAAKQGPEALRRFVNRTRMIHGLSFQQFYQPGE